jgi:hypothetical protein
MSNQVARPNFAESIRGGIDVKLVSRTVWEEAAPKAILEGDGPLKHATTIIIRRDF